MSSDPEKLAKNIYDVKTLIRIMKMAFEKPCEKHYDDNLKKEESDMLAYINNATEILLKNKYMFKAFTYSINVVYGGTKILNTPNTLQGLNAMMTLYGRYFNDDIKKALIKIVSRPSYLELKKMSEIHSEMYLAILKNLDFDKLKDDLGQFKPLFKKYFELIMIQHV